jgi:hypothetical protein
MHGGIITPMQYGKAVIACPLILLRCFLLKDGVLISFMLCVKQMYNIM